MQSRYFNHEVNFFRDIKLFSLFKKSSLLKFIHCMTVRNFTKDSYLFREGTSANILYVIASGEVEVLKNVVDRKELHFNECIDGSAL